MCSQFNYPLYIFCVFPIYWSAYVRMYLCTIHMSTAVSKDPVRDTLQVNWSEIMSNLELNPTLTGECFTNNLITREEQQRIDRKETTSDMNDILLNHAYGCWNAEYLLTFCEILEEYMATNPEGHKRIVERIYRTFEEKSG